MLYRFGVFEYDAGSGELRKAGRVVKLERQPGIVLGQLVARPGEIVSRETLSQAVWGGEVHVDFDRGLAYCLSQIRIALGDSGDSPRFVQTIPRRGCRFIAPVEMVAPVSAQEPPKADTAAISRPPVHRRAWWAAAAVLAAAIPLWNLVDSRDSSATPVVAVSVFDNETGQSELDRHVAGLSDVVVARLTALAPGRLLVVGNAAILRQPRNIRNLKAVASGVRADYVLLGQLQRDAEGYRFITHVIRLADEAHLKANRLRFPDGDLSVLDDLVIAEFERAVTAHILTDTGS